MPPPDDGILGTIGEVREQLTALPDDLLTPGTVTGLLKKLQEGEELAGVIGDVCAARRTLQPLVSRLQQLLHELGIQPGGDEARPAVEDLLGRVDQLLGSLAEQAPEADPCTTIGPPPPTFVVDSDVQPAQPSLRPLEPGALARPLARVADGFGYEADFVANELVVTTDDEAALRGLLSRHDGELVESTPGRPGLPATHLVRVDPSGEETARFVANVRKLDPGSRGDHRVSTLEGLQLLAAGADEAAQGLGVGVNWVSSTHQFVDQVSNEAPTAINVPLPTYSPNAFNWPYMSPTSTPQDINGAEAWRALEFAGRLQNRVPLAVVDGGFASNAFTSSTSNTDFPRWRAPQDADDDVGESSWDSDPTKAWHGTNVASVAAGAADNNFGTAGAAGPVADVLIVDVEGDMFTGMAGAYDAIGDGARIVNISWGARIPATLSVFAAPFAGFTSFYRDQGVLFFASAGNTPPGEAPEDVDEEDCFAFCWEAAFHMPCENGGVICVGGLNLNGDSRDAGSSYGYEWCGGLCDVDIFGPFWTYVTPEPVNVPGGNQTRLAAGTSYASPFVAGVAALVWAANPALTANDVEHILYATANPSWDAGTQRYVNALAVLTALGGNLPPLVQITQPAAGTTVDYGTQVLLSGTVEDFEDGSCFCEITWTSDVDGLLGSSHGGGSPAAARFDSPGPRTITATAKDRGGGTATATVSINVVNSPPSVSVEAPSGTGQLYRDAAYSFRAEVQDPNEPVPCINVVWTSDDPRDRLYNKGCQPTITFTTTGSRTITATATDPFGASASNSVTVTVVDPPPNSPPVATVTFPPDGSTLYFYNTISLEGRVSEPDEDDLVAVWWTVRCADTGPEEEIARGVKATWTPQKGTWWTAPGACETTHDAIITMHALDKDGTSTSSITVTMHDPVP